MINGYFEDIAVGEEIHSPERTVTESDIVTFAGFTGDWHPLHVSVPYAEAGPFGERIAHGMLSLAVATGLIDIDRKSVIAFYGIDRLRFVNPTKIHDTLHAVTTVTEKNSRDDSSGTISIDFSLRNQHDKVVISAVFLFLIAKRP